MTEHLNNLNDYLEEQSRARAAAAAAPRRPARRAPRG
jgi:hypothetical protein